MQEATFLEYLNYAYFLNNISFPQRNFYERYGRKQNQRKHRKQMIRTIFASKKIKRGF